MLSFCYVNDDEYNDAQERAIKLFARVIDDCNDKELKISAISGIIQYLTYQKRYEEAKKYLDIYPEENAINKNTLLGYCLIGNNRIKHEQRMLDYKLNELINQIRRQTLWQIEAQEKIIDVVIPDGNYQYYHCILSDLNIIKAKIYIDKQDINSSLECLKKARYHAVEYDKAMEKDGLKYTTSFLNLYVTKTKDIVRTGELTKLDEFIKAAKEKCFEKLKNNQEYIRLISK